MKNVILNSIAGKTIAVHMAAMHVRAFDPGKAGWKLDKDGKIEMKDGNPVWIDANGGEGVLSGDTISRLNGEAKALRIRAETAETALAPFKDIDPVVAKKAIADIAKIDTKKLIDAGEVDRVRTEIAAQYTGQIDELKKANGVLSTNLDNMTINGIFAQSDFVANSIAVPRDMFEATFRQNFKIKDGKVEAYDKSGNRIMSKAKIGEYAEPGEALEILVDQHPQKATILKANQNSGGGNNGGGGNRPGNRVVRRADFAKMSPHEQAQTAAEQTKGTVSIID